MLALGGKKGARNSISMMFFFCADVEIITSQRTFAYNHKICWIIFTVATLVFWRTNWLSSNDDSGPKKVVPTKGKLLELKYADPVERLWNPNLWTFLRPVLQSFSNQFNDCCCREEKKVARMLIYSFALDLTIMLIEFSSLSLFSWHSSSAANSTWNWILWYKMRRISNTCWSFSTIVHPICRWVWLLIGCEARCLAFHRNSIWTSNGMQMMNFFIA